MTRDRRRWVNAVAAVAVASLVVAACGGDDDDASDGTTSTTAADSSSTTRAGGGATAPGVTEDTITIGYSYLDFQSLVDQGLSASGWGDQELAFQTLVDHVNAEGGIHGRQVEVLFEAYSPIGTEEAEAACLRLTEDDEVFAVVGGFLGPAEPANTCIAGRQETILVGGVQSEERLAEVSAPWITDRPLRTRQAEILMSLLDQEGEIEGKSVAVVTNIDAEDVRGDVMETLGEYDVEPVEDLLSDAPIGDIPAEDAAWGPLAERLRSSGADTLLVVGNPSSAIRNVASQGLEVDLWVLDQEALRSLGTSVNLEDARGALAAAPLTDQALWDSDEVAVCREAFAEANPDIEIVEPADLQEGDEDWAQGIVTACRFLYLFVEVATEAGPELTNESFAAAAGGMSEFTIPGQPFASLGPDKHDSNDSFQLVEFDPDSGQDGGLSPLTEISDVTP